MNHAFMEYRAWSGDIARQRNGVLVAWEEGVATAYAIQQAEDRGVYFITPGARVYAGMIVGEHNRPQDLDINVCKTKKLSNVRSNSDVMVTLQAPIEMTLEQWNAQLNSYLTAAALTTQWAARAMVQLKSGGAIVHIASDAAHQGEPGNSGYSASKARH